MERVDQLEIPPVPLDTLLNRLGGPEKVAEMTGRKMRQVKRIDSITGAVKTCYERRTAEGGTLERMNIIERQHFQDGRKLIAIISEAASTGISLQAE